jgi:tetrahydromethanopterin S-methyltransferase subunit A
MDWPIEPGDYVVCNHLNHIAVVTLDDEITLPLKFIALYGKSRTENLGVERVVLNTVSNRNIRVVVVCGNEIHGHMAGQAIVALWKNGVDENRRIIGARGAIPYIQNLPDKFIERFRKQVELVDLIGVVDENVLRETLGELAKRDFKPFLGEELDFEKYLIKPESSFTQAFDLREFEVCLSPEYGIKGDTRKGRIIT